MFSFRITSVPAGEAPDWVREQWVDLTFPMDRDPSWNAEAGVLGGEPDVANLDGYSVKAGTALQILRDNGPQGTKAAEWWETESLIAEFPDSGLTFGSSFCELVES